MITVQEALNGAYGHSSKSQALHIAEATEGVNVVHRALSGLYAYAARVNPTFFAEQLSVAFAAGGWTRPAAAESIYRIELAAGGEVAVVPFDDRAKAEPGEPCVYEFGQVFRPARAIAPDPQSGNLVFWYARAPTKAATLAATLDAQWTERFDELLMLEVAIYLALKDGRMDEVALLKAERNIWANLFTAFLEHSTANLRARFGQVRRFTTNTLVPIRSLLAGESG